MMRKKKTPMKGAHEIDHVGNGPSKITQLKPFNYNWLTKTKQNKTKT